MKAPWNALFATSLLIAPAALATKVPLPVEGATLNLAVQVQPEALINESGAPNGVDASTDVFVRRTRLLINGDVGPNFSYLFQLDNANFGKYGNFGGRVIVQDAWVGWAPTGSTGGNVIYIDAGLLLIPLSRHLLTSTTNFITADVHTDEFRLGNNPFPGLRDTGVQIRGWWLDKKIGFRGGVYEGATPLSTSATGCPTGVGCIAPKRYPEFAGFINFDLIGSEEGGWVYGDFKWGKNPIVSVGLSGLYQADALKNPTTGNVSNQKLASAGVYVDLPMTEAAEFVAQTVGYLGGMGTGSANSGKGFFVDAAYRFGFVAPYASFSYFEPDDCTDPALSTGQASTCNTAIALASSRNWKAGLNFFFNKNLNHLNLEFQVNHGRSGFGPQAITQAAAGYAPAGITTSLRTPAQKSFLAHWNFIF
jgi:hypothetical protein